MHARYVQALSATAPLSYILSLQSGKDPIEGYLEITESPWFNIMDVLDVERLLLLAYESIVLDDPEREAKQRLETARIQEEYRLMRLDPAWQKRKLDCERTEKEQAAKRRKARKARRS